MSESNMSPAQELLGWALHHHSKDALVRALSMGADPNEAIGQSPRFQDPHVLPLYVCATRKEAFYLDAGHTLLNHGADPDKIHEFFYSPFQMALSQKNRAMSFLMIERSDLLQRDSNGKLVSSKSMADDVSLMEAMQERFENQTLHAHPELDPFHLWIDVPPARDSHHDIRESVMHSIPREDVADWLFNHRHFSPQRHLEILDSTGRTPLWHAAMYNKLEITRKLIAMGAKTDVVNHGGLSLMGELENLRDTCNMDSVRKARSAIFDLVSAAHASQMAGAEIDRLMRGRGMDP